MADAFPSDEEGDNFQRFLEPEVVVETNKGIKKVDPDEVTFVDSTRGTHKKLLFRNYIYHYHKTAKKQGGGVSYTCEQSHMKGRVHTVLELQIDL